MKDMIVIGGGSAGLTAALYGARAGKSVLLFEAESIGGQITSAPVVENYPGAPQISGIAFADKLFEQVVDLGVEVALEKVTEILDNGDSKTVITEDGQYETQVVILATGSKPRPLGLPNETEWIGRGISYCAVCDGAFYKDQDVAIVGGGNAALCEALFLSSLCKTVSLIHRRDAFRADTALVERAKSIPNIILITDTVVDALIGDNDLQALELRSVVSGKTSMLNVSALFVAIGHIPYSAPFINLVETDNDGYFIAGEDCATGRAGIFVAGDCRKKSVRQLTTAVADGANAASFACGYS